MKTIELNLYSFNELSEAAKEKAISKCKTVNKNDLKHDLSNAKNVFLAAAKEFIFVSYSQKSVPSQESITKKAACIEYADFTNVKIIKVIQHRNGRVTFQTEKHGFYQFFN